MQKEKENLTLSHKVENRLPCFLKSAERTLDEAKSRLSSRVDQQWY